MEDARQLATNIILDLRWVSPEDVTRVGAKAANLASLIQAGFPVPDGIVLTTDARAHLSGAGPSGTKLRTILEEVVDRSGSSSLAVRSSGVAEDHPDASFAGQYQTVLDVQGLDALEEAVYHCWDSVLESHVTAYRATHGSDATDMAILIQRMVDADAAGVAFSANPVTGVRQEAVINAVRGLGDRLVSGEASPDEWVVSGDDARCETSTEQAIDADQALAIAEMTRRVEAHFGTPQDIEWAISGGRLHLLQARPITALPEPPVEPIPIEVEIPPGFWFFDASHASDSHVPIDAFLIDLVKPASASWSEEFGYLFDGVEFRMIGGWPYQRMVPLGDRQGPVLPTWLMWILVRTVPMLRRRIVRAIETVRSDKPGRYIDRWHDEWQPEMERSIARLREVELNYLTDQELLIHIDRAHQLMFRGLQIHMLCAGAVAPILYELVNRATELLGWDAATTMELVSGTSYKSTEPARRLRDLADLASNSPELLRFVENRNEMTLERLREVNREFSERFSAYLQEYGCRALGHTTLGAPTLSEKPTLLLGVIAGQIEHGYNPDRDREANAHRRAEALRQAEERLGDRQEDIEELRRVVARAVKAYPVREDNEFFCFSSPLALLRYAALEIGRRLVDRNVIDAPEDVLYLQLDEARTALMDANDRRPRVLRSKGEWAWVKQNPGPPHYGKPPDGPPSFDFLPREARLIMESLIWNNDIIMAPEESSRQGAPSTTLTGIPASPGEYTGTVRIVMGDTQFDKIQPGDVVVCPITSPVWSVVFPIIGALVADTGGVLSHPAIIAREYRIPAVVATASATSNLHDGDLVTVDGTTGVVRLSTS